MFPTLSIGPVSVPVAPLLTIAAFWIGLWLTAREGKRLGLSDDAIFNAGFYGAVGGLLGARAFYVLQYWPYYQGRLGEIVALNLNTLAPFEGILVGLLIAVIYLQRKRTPGAPAPRTDSSSPPVKEAQAALLDALAPGLAAFAAGLSLANLASGLAYGEPTDLPWAIELWNARRHPTQAYDFLLSLGIVWVTIWLLRMGPPSGRTFVTCLALLAASRLLTEGFRGDSALLDDGWRLMQPVWLIVLLIALIGLAWIDTRRVDVTSSEAKGLGDAHGDSSLRSE
jgi:phosphatidylglycerol:prolipoprotein diacylglycerol transferase